MSYLKTLSVALIPCVTFTGGLYIGKYYSYNEASISLLGKEIPMESLELMVETIEDNFYTHDVPEAKDMEYSLIGGLVGALGDPHTSFFPPQELEDFEVAVNGEFFGIGAELSQEGDRIMVVAPLVNSPAEKAGLMAKDQIIAVDGEDFDMEVTVSDAVEQIRGPQGEKVVLTVYREQDNLITDIEIIRDRILLDSLITEYQDNGVYYVRITQFDSDTAYEFSQFTQNALANTEEPLEKLILDLRNNPGGYMDAAVSIASEFLPLAGVVVTRRDQTGDVSLYAHGNNPLADTPVVLLINEGSASASEILAGALSYHMGAQVLGQTSYGKGSVQELIPFNDGGSLKITVADWLLPDGSNINGTGIVPDIEVEFDIDAFLEKGTDTQLEKAMEIIQE